MSSITRPYVSIEKAITYPAKMMYRAIVYYLLPATMFFVLCLPLFIFVRITGLIYPKKKKAALLIVAPDIDRMGGYEKQIKVIVPYLAGQQRRVWILSNIPRYDDIRDGNGDLRYIEISFLPRFLRSPVSVACRFLFFLIREGIWGNCSVVSFAQSKFSSTISIASALLGYPVGARIASTKDLNFLKERTPENILNNISLRLADNILCLNECIRGELRRRGFCEEKLVRWRNAVFIVDGKSVEPAEREDARCKLIYAGRLEKHKGVDTVIRGLERVIREGKDACIHIYGKGPEKDFLQALVEELDLESSVIFKGEEDVSTLIGDYHTAVLMSDSEGQSNFLLEAMARGLPVIASKVPGNTEIVSDTYNGFLVGRYDVVGFAEKISLLSSDASLAREMGENGRMYVKEVHSPEKIAHLLLQLLHLEGRNEGSAAEIGK